MSIMEVDLGGDLAAMNESFRINRAKIKLPPAPPWLKGNDDLGRLYAELPLLLKRGNVYYACIVQANRLLFNKPTSRSVMTSAAEIVYNHKRPKTTISDPLIMRTFAHYLYDCKERRPEENPEWIREAASVLAGETDRSRVIIKASDGDLAMDITMQSVLVFREHLPKKVIKSTVIPIIAAPAKCFSVMILPCAYWAKGFRRYWDKL